MTKHLRGSTNHWSLRWRLLGCLIRGHAYRYGEHIDFRPAYPHGWVQCSRCHMWAKVIEWSVRRFPS